MERPGADNQIEGREFRRVKQMLYEKSGMTETQFKALSTSEIQEIKQEIREAKKEEDQGVVLTYVAVSGVVGLVLMAALYLITI
jgi:hypothetical protein